MGDLEGGVYIQWPGQMLDRELGALERRRGLKAWMLTMTTFLHQCVTNRVTGGRTVFAQWESQLGA